MRINGVRIKLENGEGGNRLPDMRINGFISFVATRGIIEIGRFLSQSDIMGSCIHVLGISVQHLLIACRAR